MIAPLTLLALLAASPASAHRLPSCLKATNGTQSLGDLQDCQVETLDEFREKKDEKGALPTQEDFDKLDEKHRSEARKLLARSGEVRDGLSRRGVVPADAKSAKDIQDLQNRLHAAAGDGGEGITPAMVDDIKQTLGGAQGSLSPDMRALLDAVSKDGGKLTPETMKLLQNAGKGAKAEGLNLNIGPSMEKALMESDFDADKTAPPGGM